MRRMVPSRRCLGDIGTSPLYAVQTVFNPSDPHPVKVSRRQHLRDHLADLLVGDDHRHRHVRPARDASRQGGERMMALIALIRRRALPQGRAPGEGCAGGARAIRRLLFFGESMIAPAIFGAFRGRGRQVSGTVSIRAGHPDHGDDHRRSVSGSAAGHGRGGAPVRPGHGRLVHRARCARCCWRHHRPPGDPEGPAAPATPSPSGRPLRHRVLLPDRCCPGRRRSRSAVRRHGALRPPHPISAWLLVVFPACILNYLGQGALILGHPASISNPVLPAGPGVGQAPDGVPRYRGDRHRLAGGHHRRLLVARQAARLGYLPRLRIQYTSERMMGRILFSGSSWLLRYPFSPSCSRSELGRAGLRLRHGRDRHDHDHNPAVLLLRPSSVALAAMDRAGGRGAP